jgi:hypothetical protein
VRSGKVSPVGHWAILVHLGPVTTQRVVGDTLERVVHNIKEAAGL